MNIKETLKSHIYQLDTQDKLIKFWELLNALPGRFELTISKELNGYVCDEKDNSTIVFVGLQDGIDQLTYLIEKRKK